MLPAPPSITPPAVVVMAAGGCGGHCGGDGWWGTRGELDFSWVGLMLFTVSLAVLVAMEQGRIASASIHMGPLENLSRSHAGITTKFTMTGTWD